MSLETGEKQSEISRRERAIKTIVYIEGLEREGIHAHSLISNPNDNNPDASLLREIDHVVIHTEPTKPTELTFRQKNKALIRRRTRTVGVRLLRGR